jgi:hypothetical protein
MISKHSEVCRSKQTSNRRVHTESILQIRVLWPLGIGSAIQNASSLEAETSIREAFVADAPARANDFENVPLVFQAAHISKNSPLPEAITRLTLAEQ